MEWPLAPAGLACTPLGWEDTAAVQALLEAGHRYFATAERRPVGNREGQERVAEALGDAQQALLGLRRGGELVGLLDLRVHVPEPGDVTVALLLIHPAQRRRGEATRVVAELLRVAAEAGLAAVHLGVRDREATAARFWEAQGFEETGRGGGVIEYVRRLG